jgi:hypothetical protein
MRMDDDAAASQERRADGRLFEEVPELYDRVRPTYPDELFADLAAITGIREGSSVLEVGAIAQRIRERMGDRVTRRYVAVLRTGRRE